MNDIEREEFLEILEEYKKKVAISKKASEKFLMELGIIDENRNRTEQYKHLPDKLS